MGKLIEDILNLRAIHEGKLQFFDKIDWVDSQGNPELNFADEVEIYKERIRMAEYFDASFSPYISVSDRLKAVLKINPLLNPAPMADFLNEEQQKWEKERTSFTLDSILKFLGPFLEEAILPDNGLIFWTSGLGTFMNLGPKEEERTITLRKIPLVSFHPIFEEKPKPKEEKRILRLVLRPKPHPQRPHPVENIHATVHPLHPNEIRCQK